MRTHVKICGITDAASAEAAVVAGADSLGFVFAPSPRQVEPEVAARICAGIPPEVTRIAVFVRPTRRDLTRVLASFPADLVQADHETTWSAGVELLPVFREGPGVIARLHSFTEDHSDRRFVFEGALSGVGRMVDWEAAATAATLGRMTLAGGLTPDNVGRAIGEVVPFGVDVSTGVESAAGVKDPARIRDFLAAVRETASVLP